LGARQKLNSANLNTVLLVAGTAGLVTASWSVFAVVAGAMIVSGIVGGGIRLWPRNRK
jgi:hypothetical protein